jgi:hypothetical protein
MQSFLEKQIGGRGLTQPAFVQSQEQEMKTKTNLKAGVSSYQTSGHGALVANHNETIATGLRVKSAVKAGPGYGALLSNHNETLATGLRVRTSVKAGAILVERPA